MKTNILRLLFVALILACMTVHAQTTKVDTIITFLQQSNKPGGVDTALFMKAVAVFRTFTSLTETEVKRLEQVSNQFIRNNNDDTCLRIRYAICMRLPDESLRINYGKSLIERIEKSHSANRNIILNLLLTNLRGPFRNGSRIAEGLQYYHNWLIKATERNDSVCIAVCSYVLGGFYRTIGLIDNNIYFYKKSIAYLDSTQRSDRLFLGLVAYGGRGAWINNVGVLGETYNYKDDMATGLKYMRLAYELRKKDGSDVSFSAQSLAHQYMIYGLPDSAAYLLEIAYKASTGSARSNLPPAFQTASQLEAKKRKFNKADSFLVKAWEVIRELNLPAQAPTGVLHPDYYRALISIDQKKYAEAAAFLLSDLPRVKTIRVETIADYKLLAEVYDKMGDAEKSKETYKRYVSLQDSLLSDQRKVNTISFDAEQQMKERELAISQLKSENKIAALTRNFSFGIIALVLLLSAVIYFRYKSKQKANAVLEKTLINLKATQTQLIQSEKMASLGELTAGIAHEIQNPLNFVNNFSEINTELIDELKQEIKTGNTEEAIAISNDIKENEQKINYHGKRADAIVKSMLQHSRSSSGQKEPTDINALCDEYLRLAYHGLRAKDKSFNASFETRFDNTIGMINLQPQEMGRVILNLINNAFYAVAECKKNSGEEYEPIVIVSTEKMDTHILISVKDNGTGIPQKVVDKIFQPFFTTKPTGLGTGLGLSLSYDIVKAHGGVLKVETEEGVGSKFIIQLPFKSIE